MVKNILGLNAFFMINKKLVEVTSLDSAFFLAILADANDIFAGEWFYQTQPTAETMSKGHLTRKRYDKAVRELSELGVIEHKNMGVPMKKYFKINEDKLLEVLR